jgi:uncharacterized protein (DUF302 family)
MIRVVASAGLMLMVAMSAPRAQEPHLTIVSKTAKFEDVRQDLNDAIVNAGLVVDFNGHIGKMLDRTAGAVGAAKPLYTNAEYFTFCAAALSRAAMEADPANIGYCPYVVFVYERVDQPGRVHVGYRRPVTSGTEASKSALAAIDALLGRIVKESVK